MLTGSAAVRVVELHHTLAVVLAHGGDKAAPCFAVGDEHAAVAVLQQAEQLHIACDRNYPVAVLRQLAPMAEPVSNRSPKPDNPSQEPITGCGHLIFVRPQPQTVYPLLPKNVALTVGEATGMTATSTVVVVVAPRRMSVALTLIAFSVGWT